MQKMEFSLCDPALCGGSDLHTTLCSESVIGAASAP